MNRASLRALLVLASILAACGGKVVHESGNDGAGGATSSSSGSQSSSSIASASTTDTTVGVTSTSDTTATATATTSAVTSTGSSSLCDNQGDCGDNASGCIGCALGGPCAQALNDCGASSACIDYSECISVCDPQDVACNQQCANKNPAGASVYTALVDCVICEQCPNDCANSPFYVCPDDN